MTPGEFFVRIPDKDFDVVAYVQEHCCSCPKEFITNPEYTSLKVVNKEVRRYHNDGRLEYVCLACEHHKKETEQSAVKVQPQIMMA